LAALNRDQRLNLGWRRRNNTLQLLDLTFVPALRTELEDRVVLMARRQDSGELWLLEQQRDEDDGSLGMVGGGPVGQAVAAGLRRLRITSRVERFPTLPRAPGVPVKAPARAAVRCELPEELGCFTRPGPPSERGLRSRSSTSRDKRCSRIRCAGSTVRRCAQCRSTPGTWSWVSEPALTTAPVRPPEVCTPGSVPSEREPGVNRDARLSRENETPASRLVAHSNRSGLLRLAALVLSDPRAHSRRVWSLELPGGQHQGRALVHGHDGHGLHPSLGSQMARHPAGVSA